MLVAGLGPRPSTMLQVSPAEALKVNDSTSLAVLRTQLVPQYVSPETMGTFCAGSEGQFLDVLAHPELGNSNTPARSAANEKLELDKNRIKRLSPRLNIEHPLISGARAGNGIGPKRRANLAWDHAAGEATQQK